MFYLLYVSFVHTLKWIRRQNMKRKAEELELDQHLTSQMIDRAINKRTYSVAYDRQKYNCVQELWHETQAKEPIC